MRADGSFKSLITGVSTVPTSQQGGRDFMKVCDNMRNDQIDGLQRRGPATLVAETLMVNDYYTDRGITDFDIDTDVLKPFSIGSDDYWMYSRGTAGDELSRRVTVIDSEGAPVNTFSNPTRYMAGTEGNDSVRLTVSGDTVFVCNTTEEVKMVDSPPDEPKMSVLAIKFSPTVYSKVIIKFNLPYTNKEMEIEYEVGQDHPVQPIPDIADVDTGVNTLASLIGQKIADAVQSEQDYFNDSMQIIFSPDSSSIGFRVIDINLGGRDVPALYSNLSISDGSGGAFIAVDKTVTAVNDLPRDFFPFSIVEVKPDPESGAGRYYMQAIPKDLGTIPSSLTQPQTAFHAAGPGAVQPNPESQFYSGHWYSDFGDNTENGVQGEGFDFPFPITSPNTIAWEQYLVADTGPAASSSTTVMYTTISPPGTGDLAANNVPFVSLWKRNGDDQNPDTIFEFDFVARTTMYKSSYPVSNVTGLQLDEWTGTLDVGIKLEPAAVYYIYVTNPADNATDRLTEVEWLECSQPDQDTMIDAKTFPHVLHRRDDGTFEFGDFNQVSSGAIPSMQARKAGDNLTNPPPSFINNKIRDVSVHQNRLAILTEDKVSFSVSGQLNDWWRGTTSQLLPSGPIDIQSTSSAAGDLRSFVVHNNDLMVFGPYGQFRFSGREAITPQNAALPQAASYPATLVARPVSAGNDVYFPTTYGNSAGLSQFSLDPQIQNLSVALPLADRQKNLIKGDISQIIAEPNLGIVLNRVADDRSVIYTMEFLPNVDILEPVESTWARWVFEFGCRIISMRITGAFVEFVAVGRESEYDERIPRLFRLPLHAQQERQVYLDCRMSQDGIYRDITLPSLYPLHYDSGDIPTRDMTFVQGEGCPNPGAAVTYNGAAYPKYVLDQNMNGGTVWYGYEYESTVTMPPIVTRDKAGIRMTQAHKRINSVTVSVQGSCKLQDRSGPEQSYVGDEDVEDVRFQVKGQSEELDIKVTSIGHDLMDLNQAEWTGTYYKAGRRF